MTMQELVPVVALLIAIVGLVAQFRWHRRNTGPPAFLVTWSMTPAGLVLTAVNGGDTQTRRLWVELVPETGGRVRLVTPGAVRHVAVDAEVEFTVVEAPHVTGIGIDLCWLDGRRVRRLRATPPGRGYGFAA
ncbi:hypothetical protein [Cryptosporangium arvum]|uniref:hypothetical protein n=1 Tax=Cryptosporangium arvum TaxID=80871 RepID=UPI0004B1AFBA|nr:hypothetical protein [Cryptosporangium arvum]